MIYILMLKKQQNHKLKSENFIFELQSKILNFLLENFKIFGFKKYSIILCDIHIIENQLNNIDKQKDILLWHPTLVANNLSLFKRFVNNIVILKHKTVLLQKISDRNPINENMAINNDFKIMYIEDYEDITNSEYKLILKPKIIKIKNLINYDR